MKLLTNNAGKLGFGIAVVFGGCLLALGLTLAQTSKVAKAVEVTPTQELDQAVSSDEVAPNASLMSEAPIVEAQEKPEKDAVEVIQLAPLTPKESLTISEHEVALKQATNTIERKRQDFNKKFDKYVEKETAAFKALVENRTKFIGEIAATRDQKVECFVLGLTKETQKTCGTDIWAISAKGEVYKLK